MILLHCSVCLALLQLPAVFLILLPVVALSCLVTVAKYGLLLLDHSVTGVWLAEKGWYIRLRNQQEQGPFALAPGSHLGSRSIRLSLQGGGLRKRHILLTRSSIGAEQFRRLQVFLRWSPDHQQASNLS